MSDMPLKLMCILAHPDDESMGTGGILAKYSAEGIQTFVVTATRGERGWDTSAPDYPGETGLGKIREQELLNATKVLGVRSLFFLDYIDGDLDQAPHKEITAKLVSILRSVQPHVVVTFGSDGGYGHPDHIAISQFTTAAIMRAADSQYQLAANDRTHAVSKLYHMVVDGRLEDLYQQVFGEISMNVKGVVRRGIAWPDWEITTWIDATKQWRMVWNAVQCHKTQIPSEEWRNSLSEDTLQRLWGTQVFYRVMSLVNSGPERETDLFAGLR
jgi:LmbE family N-acetylglucosaminyl deacetylase